MPHIGTLAALLARSISGMVPRDVIAMTDAIGWKAGADMLRKSAMGETMTGFSTAAGTGAELTGFVGSVAGQFFSARIAQDAQQWPAHSRIGVLSEAGFAASEVTEFAPAAPVLFTNGFVLTEPSKVVALAVYSLELLNTRGAADVIEADLRKAIGRGLDKIFASRLSPGSAGGFAATASALADLREVAGMLISVTGQSMILAAAIDVAQRLATMAPDGMEVFPLMPLVGVGEIKGVPCYPSDQLTAGSLLAIDPSGLAATISAVNITVSKNTAVELDSVPNMPANLLSLFQTSGVAVRAEAEFVCTPLRPQDVSVEVTSCAWTEA